MTTGNIPTDAEIRKAVEADHKQLLTDCLTPDRGYSYPIDNVKKLVKAQQAETERLRSILGQIEVQYTLTFHWGRNALTALRTIRYLTMLAQENNGGRKESGGQEEDDGREIN